MIHWVIALTLLSLIQHRIFKLTRIQLERTWVRLGASNFLALLAADLVKNLAEEFAFEWWSGVVVMFTSFLIGESVFYSKNKTTKISVYTFSSVYIGFAWLSYSDSLNHWFLIVASLGVSLVSLIISFAFLNISEKVELSDLTKSLKEAPIFLIVSSVLILFFSYLSR